MEQIVFNTIQKALTYRKQCPLCKNKLHLHRDSSGDEVTYDQRFIKVRDKSTLTILDMDTDSVSIEYIVREQHDFNASGYSRIQKTAAPAILPPGKLILGFNLECYFCHQYSYNTAFHINTGEGRFYFATLNSEWIEIESGPNVLEIHNIYATGITKYTQYLANGETKGCEIPIIPLDVESPHETLARLKKLIIFT